MTGRGCKYPNKVKHATKSEATQIARSLMGKAKGRLRYHSYKCGDHFHVATNTTKYRKEI